MYNSLKSNIFTFGNRQTSTIRYFLLITILQATNLVHSQDASWFEPEETEMILTSGGDTTNSYAPLSIAARSPIECVLKCQAKSLTPFYADEDTTIRFKGFVGGRVDGGKCFCLKNSPDKQIDSGGGTSNVFPVKGNIYTKLSQVPLYFILFIFFCRQI